MPYEITIIRNSDGEKRIHRCDEDWGIGDDWQWTEGNFGCDCNRHLFFWRAENDLPQSAWPDDDVECGETLYSVILPDGQKHPEV